MEKDFVSKVVARAYEFVCRCIFAELCCVGEIDFTPSKIGSCWICDADRDAELDVVAVDQQHHCLFVGKCKYHRDPVGLSVFHKLTKNPWRRGAANRFPGRSDPLRHFPQERLNGGDDG